MTDTDKKDEAKEAAKWFDALATVERKHPFVWGEARKRNARRYELAAAALRQPEVTDEMVTAFLEGDRPYFTRRAIDKSAHEVCRHTSREVIEPEVVARYEYTPGGQAGADATALRMNTRAALIAALAAGRK